MQFVYFNTASNKFNFINGDGSLQISNGQPIIKTSNAELKYIDAIDQFDKYTVDLNSNNNYIVHINFSAINNDICFIDNLTLEEALKKYCIEVVDSAGNVLAKYILADSTNPIIHFSTTLFVENTDSIIIQSNYNNLKTYEHGCSVLLETF